MYCKKCGKEIPEDSIFCNFCGTNQKEVNAQAEEVDSIKEDIIVSPTVEGHKEQSSTLIDKFKNLSSKQKYLLYGYIVWTVIHSALLAAGEDEKGFYPYDNDGDLYFEYNIVCYGLTEFIVYVALVPMVLFALYKLWHKLHKR